MKAKTLKILAVSTILMGCGKKYENVEPGAVITLQVNFSEPDGDRKSIACLYSVPERYKPEQAWPLLITLHGWGGNAAAFHDLWKQTSDSLEVILLTPQAEDRIGEGLGWAWGRNAEHTVRICLDMMKKAVHIDPRRIYLAGFSAGGSLSYSMALKSPHIFRGIASLGARFDKSLLSPATERLRAIGAYQKLRVYVGHGTLEKNFPTEPELAATTFRNLGAEVKFVPYHGVGHALPEPKERELARIIAYLECGK